MSLFTGQSNICNSQYYTSLKNLLGTSPFKLLTYLSGATEFRDKLLASLSNRLMKLCLGK
jgi:hypothetical protein